MAHKARMVQSFSGGPILTELINAAATRVERRIEKIPARKPDPGGTGAHRMTGTGPPKGRSRRKK